MGFLTAAPMHWPRSRLGVPVPVDGKVRLLPDFQMKMSPKHCLQNETDSTDTSEKTIEDRTSQSQQSMCHTGSIKSSVFAFKNPF